MTDLYNSSEEDNQNDQEDHDNASSPGRRAREADVTEAIAASRALLDAQKKERAEADERKQEES